VALLAGSLLAVGCASGDKKPDGPKKPAGPDIPAGAPDKPADKPAEKPGPTQPGHPPDDQPAGGGGGGGNALDQIAKDLSLRDKERLALAEHYFKVGKQLYDQFDYAEAAKNFQKARDADPNNKDVQRYYIMASMLAGERQPEFEAVAETLRNERQVSIQQEVIELKRLHDEGIRLLQAREFDKAIVRFEQVLEKIRWFPYPVSDSGIEKSARENIILAKKQKREQANLERIDREKRAFAEAVKEEEEQRKRERFLIEKLIRDGVEQLSRRQYEKAEQTFTNVLERDPNNAQAEKFLEVAVEGRHVAADIHSYEDRVREDLTDWDNTTEVANPYLPAGSVVIYPDKRHWLEKVAKRTSGIAQQTAEDPQWVQDYKKKLANQKVTFNFAATPFSEVVSFLQDITGLNITVSKQIDQDQVKVNLRLKDVKLEDALKIILEQTGFARSFKNETLWISPKEEAKGEYYLDIYDVQDILAAIPDFPGPRITIKSAKGGGGGRGGQGSFSFDDDTQEEQGLVIEPEKLEALIKNSTGADEVWGDPASYELHRGQIIVNQTKETHEAIKRVLTNLRRNVGLFVQVEARFVDIFNDFLQDIGVDYRGLGLSDQGSNPALPIWGVPLALDPNIPQNDALRRGGGGQGDDIGFGQRVTPRNAAKRIGPKVGPVPFFGSSYLGGRLQNILDGGDGYFGGDRLDGTSIAGAALPKGLAYQLTLLDPLQINAIVRAEEEREKQKIVTAPVVVAANRQRVHISVVTQRAYIADYELSSGGTGLVVAEVADPIVQTLQEGIILDVRPTISADRKYVTLDLRPTLAGLQALREIPVNLGTISNAAINVNIEVPEIKLQEAYTSVTVPDGGTALVGGFREFNEKIQRSGVPFVDNVPLLNVLFKREAELRETESLVILITARIIILRDEEKKRYNTTAK
jgi:type II secretory pathway component GspD/PulD (secretin)/Tfp pilus assembly protein PilF